MQPYSRLSKTFWQTQNWTALNTTSSTVSHWLLYLLLSASSVLPFSFSLSLWRTTCGKEKNKTQIPHKERREQKSWIYFCYLLTQMFLIQLCPGSTDDTSYCSLTITDSVQTKKPANILHKESPTCATLPLTPALVFFAPKRVHERLHRPERAGRPPDTLPLYALFL